MKKLLTVLLCLTLMLSLSASVFAADFGSISVKNATIGESYAGYRIFDSTYADADTVAYTIQSTDPWYGAVSAATDLFTLSQVRDTTTYVVEQKGTDEAIIAWLNTPANLTGKTPDLTSQTVKVDGQVQWDNVPFGYYLITSTMGAVVSVDSNTPSVVLLDKNQGPAWDDPNDTDEVGGKYIIEDAKKVKVADYAIGDTVTQSIEVYNATNWDGTEQIHTYTITDVLPAGMTLDESSVVVKVNNATLAAAAYTAVLAGDTNTLTVTIPWVTVSGTTVTENYLNKSDIVITYNVRMNEKTVLGTTTGNKNTAKVSWNYVDPDTPAVPKTPGTGKGSLTEMSTTVYSAGIVLNKVDKKTKTALNGAKFSISGDNANAVKINNIFVKSDVTGKQYMLKDGSFTETAAVTDKTNAGYNADSYDSTTQMYTTVSAIALDTSTAEFIRSGYVKTGTITFEGLKAGSYDVTELVSPLGYNILTSAIPVVITFNDDAAAPAFTATVDGDAATVENGIVKMTVANQAGTVLPGTGGMGTTLFYVIGIGLLLGAAIVVVARKKTRG